MCLEQMALDRNLTCAQVSHKRHKPECTDSRLSCASPILALVEDHWRSLESNAVRKSYELFFAFQLHDSRLDFEEGIELNLESLIN